MATLADLLRLQPAIVPRYEGTLADAMSAGWAGKGQALPQEWVDPTAALDAAKMQRKGRHLSGLSQLLLGLFGQYEENPATGERRAALPSAVQALPEMPKAIADMIQRGVTGDYQPTTEDPMTGRMYDPRQYEDAMNLAALVSTGGMPIPRPLNSLGMGILVHHGSPRAGIDVLKRSERGPLGPGVYASPHQPLAQRYAGEDGKVYSFEAPDDIFHGMKPWDAGSDVNPYQIWRDQAKAVVSVAPEAKRAEIKALFEKMWPDDGYPFFQRLSNIMGSQEDAQKLLQKAGYKGISANVDGPEVVLFDQVPLPGQ